MIEIKPRSEELSNRAEAPATAKAFYDEEKAIIGEKVLENAIECKTLAVLPEFQRLGIGKKVISWMFERATKDGAVIFCDASSKGIELYLRHGLKVVGHVTLPGKSVAIERDNEPDSTCINLPELSVPVLCWNPPPSGGKL